MSWKEDTRSRSKRDKNRVFKKNHYRNISATNNSSSSTQLDPQPIRGLVDVADSSDDRFSSRSLQQWSPGMSEDDIYHEELNEQMTAKDFEYLQNMPTTAGYEIFTYSSEKQWATDEIEANKSLANSYFTMNLALINAGLDTIPFYKRMDYSSSMFDKTDINRMNLEAEIAENKYQSILKSLEDGGSKPNSGGKTKRNLSATSNKSNKENDSKVEQLNKVVIEEKDELDELLSLTESNMAKVSFKDDGPGEDNKDNVIKDDSKVESTEKVDSANNKDDIQQWLDDVLE